MIARVLAYLRSLRASSDLVHVAIVPPDVSERLLATPGARLRSRFEVVLPVESETVLYVVETDEEVEQ